MIGENVSAPEPEAFEPFWRTRQRSENIEDGAGIEPVFQGFARFRVHFLVTQW
jgi:hypothetical protein